MFVLLLLFDFRRNVHDFAAVRAQLSCFLKKNLALVLNEINFAHVCIVFKLTNPTGIGGAKIPPARGARACAHAEFRSRAHTRESLLPFSLGF